MGHRLAALILAVGMAATPAYGFIDVFRPETLGAMCRRADSITVMKVDKVSKDKGVVVYRKVEDLKGMFPRDVIREVLGSAHLEPERKHYLDWVDEGKTAVFFRYESRVAICIDRQTTVFDAGPPKDDSDLWTVATRTEPFFSRSYYGDPETLATAVKDVLAGKDAEVPCMVGERDKELRERRGKVVRVHASLERKDYDLKRDLVPDGGDDTKDK